MNKLNDIFKMISQMEKNAEEVKLGKHEIELSAINDLENLLKNNGTIYTQFLAADNLIKPNLQKAQDEAKKAFSLLNKYIDGVESTKQIINKLETQLKELGIDSKTAFKDKFANVEKIKSLNTSEWNDWKNNYNNFIKAQAPNID